MKDRKPTEFETKVLKRIAVRYGAFQGGDSLVHWSAAARRLEKLGYAGKPGLYWGITEKGKKFLAEIAEGK